MNDMNRISHMNAHVRKKRSRSVNWLEEDKKLLTVLICEKIKIIENKSLKVNMNMKKASTWDELLQRFNAKCKGVQRTIHQMKIQWKQLKINAKNNNPTFYEEIKSGCITSLPSSYNNAQAVADGVESTLDSESKSELSSDENALSFIKTKKPKHKSYYLHIHNCCVALITEHGRPAELLDDLAFRKILTKIPMTNEERSKLTSEFIKECINDDELLSSEGSDEDDVFGDDDDKSDDGEILNENSSLKSKVKKEKEECSCPFRHTDCHMPGCAAIAQDTFRHFATIKTEPIDPTSQTDDNLDSAIEIENTNRTPKQPPIKKTKFCHNKRKIDAFDAFGNSVAMQLKSLSESSALIAQSQIQNTLTKCGMADLKNKRSSKSNSKIDVNNSVDNDEDTFSGTDDANEVPIVFKI